MNLRQYSFAAGLFLALAIFFAGCAGSTRVLGPAGAVAPSTPWAFFSRLDQVVASTGVGTGAWARVPGFPYLRTDRFLVAVKKRLDNSLIYRRTD